MPKVRTKDGLAKRKEAYNFDRHDAVRELRPLVSGDDVWVQDIICVAKVLSPAEKPSSYIVEKPSGVIQRNRSHLVPLTRLQLQYPATLRRPLSGPAGVTLREGFFLRLSG
ncbi:hypothetical protein HPB50_026515 [Hyalomma asiaticum]|uniref:Uncharacterized protein n=1 Tax=Hyalomma asiaticum TaxID=266040 RepID=A0ACB7S6D9_HYAAI|nr:hypothetical protein HPB50_026515 [Hyalomma asiaticum]